MTRARSVAGLLTAVLVSVLATDSLAKQDTESFTLRVHASHGEYDLETRVVEGARPGGEAPAVRGRARAAFAARLSSGDHVFESTVAPGGGVITEMQSVGAGGAVGTAREGQAFNKFSQKCTSTWVTAGFGPSWFLSAREPGESAGSWAVRHAEGLALVAGIAPPVTGADDEGTVIPSVVIASLPVAETTWKDALGLTHTVSTRKKRSESEAAWAERHAEAVAALVEEFPPAPSG